MFVPFGGGPRMCPGNEYARLVILVFIHNVVTSFRWDKMIPREKIVNDPLPRPTQGFPVIDKAFGFDIAVEEAQCAINAAHVESDSTENGIGLVKLMGRYNGYIAMYATLASQDVDCCLIPESPFILKGPGRLFDYIDKRLKENGHMVIVIAEGAGQQIKGVGGVEYA